MKQLLSLLFILLLNQTMHAQDHRLDSLMRLLDTTSDTTKVNVLLELNKHYVGVDKTKSISYAQQAKQMAHAYEFEKGKAYALKGIGLAYYVDGEYPETLDYWQKSLELFSAMGDKTGESNMLNNIGVVYANQGWDAKAIEFYLKSLKAGEASGNKLRIATALLNIGSVYYNNTATHDKALKYYLKALPLSKEIGDQTTLGSLLINVGEIYVAKNKLEVGLSYYQEALRVLQAANIEDKVAYCLNSIAKVHLQKGALVTAMENHQQAHAIAKAASAKLEIVQSLLGIGQLYSKMAQPQQALVTFKEARDIAQEIGAQYELKDAYQGLANAYSALGNFQQAFNYQEKLLAVKDTLYNSETNKKIVNLQANYESEKKQAQIDLLTKDKALQNAALQRQKLVKNVLLAGFIFILVLAFVLFRNYQNKARANQLLTLKNQEIHEQKEELAAKSDRLEKMYHDLANTQAQLVQSEKMASLGQLTAGVAHEINNPINFVSAGINSLRTNFTDIMELMWGYLALKPQEDNRIPLQNLDKLRKEIEVEELIEESEKLFKSIKNGANRTTEIVKSLKNFTRLDESTLKTADIHEGLDSTLVILMNQIKDRITIIKDYGKLEPIECYPGQLNQVFMNILSNAVQAIKSEGTITIQTRYQGDKVMVSIKDTGMGMSEAVRKHIFDPFFTTKDVGEGTGLGLSISYGIIEKHKGKIEVKSEPGQGTEFIICLSTKLSETETEAAPAAVAAANTAAVPLH